MQEWQNLSEDEKEKDILKMLQDLVEEREAMEKVLKYLEQQQKEILNNNIKNTEE